MQIWEEFIEKSFTDNRPESQQSTRCEVKGPSIVDMEVKHEIQCAKKRKARGLDKIKIDAPKLRITILKSRNTKGMG